MAIPEVDKSLTKALREIPDKGKSENGRINTGDLWWAWVDLNHQPRPYQSSAIRFYNNLQDRGDCQNTRKSYKTSYVVGWIVGRKKPRILWQSTFFLEPRSSVRIVLRRRFEKPVSSSMSARHSVESRKRADW